MKTCLQGLKQIESTGLFGIDHPHGIENVLIWEFILLGLVFLGESLTSQKECLFGERPCQCIFQEIPAVLCRSILQTLWYVKWLLCLSKAFPKSFYASSVATSYSGSTSGCTCWMPKMPSSYAGDALLLNKAGWWCQESSFLMETVHMVCWYEDTYLAGNKSLIMCTVWECV